MPSGRLERRQTGNLEQEAILQDFLTKLGAPPEEGFAVVMAGPSTAEHRSLRRICSRWNWRLFGANCCGEALSLARKHHPPVVLCEPGLPDGDWRTLLGGLSVLPQQPRLIVCSRLADHYLWADVLSLGGYDVLTMPFDAAEVSRAVFLAWHSSREARARKAVRVANVA